MKNSFHIIDAFLHGVIWLQKFSDNKDRELLLVRHDAESCCQTQGLLAVTLSIQDSTTSPSHLTQTSVLSLRISGKMSSKWAPQKSWCRPSTLFFSIWIWICPQIGIQTYWSFKHECQAVQHAIYKFLEEKTVSGCCFSQRQSTTDSCSLHSRKQLKQIRHMSKINYLGCWKFPNCTLYVYIYIYIYMCVCVCVCVCLCVCVCVCVCASVYLNG